MDSVSIKLAVYCPTVPHTNMTYDWVVCLTVDWRRLWRPVTCLWRQTAVIDRRWTCHGIYTVTLHTTHSQHPANKQVYGQVASATCSPTR